MKTIVSIIGLILFWQTGAAQWFQITKQRNIGAEGSGIGMFSYDQIHRLPNGNLCLTTYANQDTLYDKMIWGYGDGDAWYLEMDTAFSSVKQWIIGGDKADRLQYAILTSDSCLLSLFMSISDSGYDKSQNNKGDNDYWIVKTDINGNKLWDITLGSAYEDVPNRIYETSDSTYLVLGNSATPFPSGDVSDSAQSDAPWFVILDKNGNLINEYRIHPTLTIPYALSYLPFNLYAIHFRIAVGGAWTNSPGQFGALVLESDTTIFASWGNMFVGGLGGGYGGVIYDNKTDNFYYALHFGVVDTNQNCHEISRGGVDGMVYKTDWLGNIIWTKLYGNDCRDYLAGVIDYNDTLLLAYGQTNSSAGNEISSTVHAYDTNCTISRPNLWLLLINKNNPLQYFDTIFGGNRSDGCWTNSLTRYDDSTFYWVTASSSDSSFEKTTHKHDTTLNKNELWLIKMIISPYALSGAGWHTAEASAPPLLYPNPATDILNVMFDSKKPYKLIIHNIQGATVLTSNCSAGPCNIFIGNLPPAIYTYTVTMQDGTSFYGKFIKN
ncbi:MAG: T9SS type A sorting domain-containing protein [Bacteroidetes bacterium]|nr:T9SS type A sorting domain-containing protein [Bacteroidota bacterium]